VRGQGFEIQQPPSPSHCCAMGPFLSRFTGEELYEVHHKGITGE
jgi:hypothetical protein